VNLDDDRHAPSVDGQSVLRALRSFEVDDYWADLMGLPRAVSMSEVPLADLASEAKLSMERTLAAVEELILTGVPGIGLDGDLVTLLTTT
jgi:hypothetical protein